MKVHRLAVQLLALFSVACNNGFVWANEDESDIEASPAGLEAPEDAESHAFEAEVHRMLDIVVNSLYQNKDVFLRELISNASDALDKLRYLSLTKPDTYKLTDGDGEEVPLEVKLEFDEETRTVTIRDTGIGMTHDELVENLGTVARSGTTRFLEALESGGENMVSQIGQFGVGFYSAFLVADRVTVASKHPSSDTQWVWQSMNGASDFKIYKDPRGDSLKRGTEITLHLKEDCLEYAQEYRMSELAKHYSEFVQHPIYLKTITTMEVPDEDADTDDDSESLDEDDLEVGDEEDSIDDEDDEPKMKTVTTSSWEEINVNPALWTREKESISDDEYQSFWQVLSSDSSNATTWSHFNAEGNINFKSIVYLPEKLPETHTSGNIDKIPGGMKLYVRRVLISDEFDLMPRYLGFIRGVVDSDDLPLNVNRETLQESKIISVIRKKLIRKTLEMIKSLTKEEKSDEEEVEIDADGNVIEVESEPKKKESRYIKWYEKFAPSIKLGVIEDEPNRNKLTKLLRFRSSKTGTDSWTSMEEYIENKKDWQDEIYVLAGIDVETVEKSPFLDPFHEKDVEVLYLVDPIDEYMFGHVREFDNHKIVHVSSAGVKFKDEDEDLLKRREKAYNKKFKPLTKWLKSLYKGSVSRVSVSKRLGSAPAIVSSGEYGHSANMERIMRAQAMQHGQDQHSMKAMKILEINPRHPLILKLLEGCPPEKDKDAEDEDEFVVSEETIDSAWVLHDMATLSGGFPLQDPDEHSKRMMKFLQSSLSVESLELEAEIDPPVEDDEPPEIDVQKLGYGNVGPDGGINLMDFDGDIPDLDISVGE